MRIARGIPTIWLRRLLNIAGVLLAVNGTLFAAQAYRMVRDYCVHSFSSESAPSAMIAEVERAPETINTYLTMTLIGFIIISVGGALCARIEKFRATRGVHEQSRGE